MKYLKYTKKSIENDITDIHFIIIGVLESLSPPPVISYPPFPVDEYHSHMLTLQVCIHKQYIEFFCVF